MVGPWLAGSRLALLTRLLIIAAQFGLCEQVRETTAVAAAWQDDSRLWEFLLAPRGICLWRLRRGSTACKDEHQGAESWSSSVCSSDGRAMEGRCSRGGEGE